MLAGDKRCVVGTLKLVVLLALLILALGVARGTGASRAVADTVGTASPPSFQAVAIVVAEGGGAAVECGRAGRRDSGSAPSLGKSIDDSVITTKVKAALLASSGGGTDISVETREGRVKLTGSVASLAQLARAVRAACTVKGVQVVDNNITLKK